MSGLNIIDSQGTMVYIVDVPTTPWTDCSDAIAAIQAGDLLGCPQSIGDLGESRNVTEYKCLSSDETAKSLGAISRGSMDLGVLLDPDDTSGQDALKTAFKSNTPVMIGIELSDADTSVGPVGASGTMYWFEGGVSAMTTSIALDEAVTGSFTVEISSEIIECPGIPGTA
jgi:hypothetical protein